MGLPDSFEYSLHSALKHGKRNLITDVPGVKVGNVTVIGRDVNTGVTAVLPHDGNLFKDKVMAAASVLNGFGKSAGLVQISELGTIETPIILTNTFSVGTALTALTKYMLVDNTDIGVTTGTVNCVVAECNDGRLNDIRGMHVEEEHVIQAITKADSDFAEGAVGSGTGMCCLGVKGGIGSSSRILKIDGQEYHVGSLVMSNFGEAGNLIIGGKHIDTREESLPTLRDSKDQGSIIMIIATDIPLSERQLKRLCNRTPVSLGRCGSYMGNGSGDIAIAFTTANKVPHYSSGKFLNMAMIHDDDIDPVFRATVEATEEAIISSLYHAGSVTGIRGKCAHSLREFIG